MNRQTVLLKDDLIALQPGSIDHVKPFYEAVHESLPELKKWMTWAIKGYTEEDALQYLNYQYLHWEKDEAYEFVIKSLTTNRVIGSVGLNQVNRVHGMSNLGYWVRSSQTGQGIASRAARLVARFGIEQLGFTRIEIVAAVGNIASQKAAIKAGATREGVLRNRLIVQGKPTDAVMHSITSKDFGI